MQLSENMAEKCYEASNHRQNQKTEREESKVDKYQNVRDSKAKNREIMVEVSLLVDRAWPENEKCHLSVIISPLSLVKRASKKSQSEKKYQKAKS